MTSWMRTGLFFFLLFAGAVIFVVFGTQASYALGGGGGVASGTCLGATIVDPDMKTNTSRCVSTGTGFFSASGILTTALCLVQSIIAQSMFSVYCAIAEAMRPVIGKLLILYLLFYVISFMFGIGDATLKEAGIRLIKILTILVLATNPDLFYGIMYKSWFSALDGVSRFLYELDVRDAQGNPVFGDEASQPGADDRTAGIFTRIDDLFKAVVGAGNVLGLMVLALAFLVTGSGFLVGFLLMMGTFMMFVAFFNIVMLYATSVLGLAFLLMFTPVFLAMLLFRQTARLWTRFIAKLISYTLQPIIVLLYLFVIVNALNAGKFLAELGGENLNADTIKKCYEAATGRDKCYKQYRQCLGPCVDKPDDGNDCDPNQVKTCQDTLKSCLENAEKEDQHKDECYTRNADGDKVIDIRGHHVTDAAWAKIRFVMPTFVDPDTGQSMVGDENENPDILKKIRKAALSYVVAFIVLNAVTISFLRKVPEIAALLSMYQSQHQSPMQAATSAQQLRSLTEGGGGGGGLGASVSRGVDKFGKEGGLSGAFDRQGFFGSNRGGEAGKFFRNIFRSE